eukprot:767277-Hanusia_phi.AAC.4
MAKSGGEVHVRCSHTAPALRQSDRTDSDRFAFELLMPLQVITSQMTCVWELRHIRHQGPESSGSHSLTNKVAHQKALQEHMI